MIQKDYVENLKSLLEILDRIEEWLVYSYGKCSKIGIKENYSREEYDFFETLTSRFARAVDFLIRKIYRSIDAIELEDQGTIIDIVNRAHKRGLFDEIERVKEMKALRNEIVHEYVDQDLDVCFADILDLTPTLLEMIGRVRQYAKRYITST